MLDGVLDKIKMIIGIAKFDDTKILIDANYKLAHEVTLKNVILISFIIKDNDKFYPLLFLKRFISSKKIGGKLVKIGEKVLNVV